jgi:hypothetical protein
VFPYVESWQTTQGDITLVASHDPFRFDAARLRRRIASQPYHDALRFAWHVDSLEGFMARRIAGADLAKKIHALPLKTINTDDQNHLEFDFARSVGTVRNFSIEQIYEEGRKFPDLRAAFGNAEVDWSEIERNRLMLIPFAARDQSLIGVEEGRMRGRFDQAVSIGDWAMARQVLRLNGDRLPFNMSRALLPIVFIESNDPKAEMAIANHYSYSQEEALALKAVYAVKQQQWDHALNTSLDVINLLRKSPWASEFVVDRLFSVFPLIAQNTQGGAERLIAALLESPFAVYAFDGARYSAAFMLAKADAGNDYCAILKKDGHYLRAGNIEYLKYLYNCKDNDESTKKRIAKEIQGVASGQSSSFRQILEYLGYEATKK